MTAINYISDDLIFTEKILPTTIDQDTTLRIDYRAKPEVHINNATWQVHLTYHDVYHNQYILKLSGVEPDIHNPFVLEELD